MKRFVENKVGYKSIFIWILIFGFNLKASDLTTQDFASFKSLNIISKINIENDKFGRSYYISEGKLFRDDLELDLNNKTETLKKTCILILEPSNNPDKKKNGIQAGDSLKFKPELTYDLTVIKFTFQKNHTKISDFWCRNDSQKSPDVNEVRDLIKGVFDIQN